jgi:G3E family GTPase
LRVFDSDPIRTLFSVDGIFCLIDTFNVLDLDYQSTELAIDQAAMSDLVLLNKTDLVPEAVQLEVRQMLLAAQRSMKLLDVVNAEVSPEILFGPTEPVRHRARGTVQDTHSDLYESVSFYWKIPIRAEAFRRFAEALPSKILRGKGLLSLTIKDQERPSRGIFQFVGKRSLVELESGDGPERSQVVLIARRGELDRSAIDAALELCPGARAALPIAQRRRPKRPMICE